MHETFSNFEIGEFLVNFYMHLNFANIANLRKNKVVVNFYTMLIHRHNMA